jgi:hypothetical protein
MAGDRDTFSFEDMRPEEQAIITALQEAHTLGHEQLHISDLQAVNGWEGPTGNSKVRNNLRRLMRYGWIHRPIDGTYALVTKHETAPSCEAVVETAPQPEAVRPPLVQIRRRGEIKPNPMALNEAQVRALRIGDLNNVAAIKKLDCAIYNACLTQAESGNWPGFSCTSCTAYVAPDRFQRELDVLALRAAQTASDELEKYGKVNRIRGVKPGSDAKRGAVVVDDGELDSL